MLLPHVFLSLKTQTILHPSSPEHPLTLLLVSWFINPPSLLLFIAVRLFIRLIKVRIKRTTKYPIMVRWLLICRWRGAFVCVFCRGDCLIVRVEISSCVLAVNVCVCVQVKCGIGERRGGLCLSCLHVEVLLCFCFCLHISIQLLCFVFLCSVHFGFTVMMMMDDDDGGECSLFLFYPFPWFSGGVISLLPDLISINVSAIATFFLSSFFLFLVFLIAKRPSPLLSSLSLLFSTLRSYTPFSLSSFIQKEYLDSHPDCIPIPLLFTASSSRSSTLIALYPFITLLLFLLQIHSLLPSFSLSLYPSSFSP